MTTANEELLQGGAGPSDNQEGDYDAELSHSHIKQEVVRLHETLSALQGKREAMEAEHKSSPQDERETLLKQVKENNQEIASHGQTVCSTSLLTEIRERMEQITEQIRQLEQDSEEAQGYMESFEEVRAQEQDKMTQSQENIVSILEHCSRQGDGGGPIREHRQRTDNRIPAAAAGPGEGAAAGGEDQRGAQLLKERVGTMETELLTYRDLDTLRHTGEEKKKSLQEERVSLTQRRDSFKQLLRR
ncbi:hypothetical protein KUCAC02_017555 [Chaenocephalus aceratus]|uniref:Uncharacterized protein n=1 Tax=Chaenocephalus aceratus TaxID=36190 RepID=A0ACB9W2I0_CHAAC|nr:hypothetical protein KUCAC02_017555 [Chaenocephalus aceratus]